MMRHVKTLQRALLKLGKVKESERLEAIETKVHHGTVIAIGGAEDKSFHGKILKKVFEVAGGHGIDVTLIPWASEKKDAGEIYKKIFSHFGAKTVFLLKDKSKEDALDAFERSALIFLVGGDQKRLLDTLDDLDLIKELRKFSEEGRTIAGTSAGASILGKHMPYYDDDKESVVYFEGLDLVPETIIDQHFTQRHRIKRLQYAVARFNIKGVGLSEDNAMGFINGKEIFRIGDDITVIDPTE